MEKLIVFIPCYNAEKYISETIDSLIKQTFKDFKILVIDDGSTDRSRDIVKQYAMQDHRILLVENEINRGIVYTRNRGLKLCDCEYIALMDADDIAPLYRLDEEVRYLEKHPEIDAVGGLYQLIDEDGNELPTNLKPVLSDAAIRANMLFFNPIVNGSMMFRRKVAVDNEIIYRESNRTLEDYRFWSEFLIYGRINNINKILQYYRVSRTSISRKTQREELDKRNQDFDEIHELLFQIMKIRLSDKDKRLIKKATHDVGELEGILERLRFFKALFVMQRQENAGDSEFNRELNKVCKEYRNKELINWLKD